MMQIRRQSYIRRQGFAGESAQIEKKAQPDAANWHNQEVRGGSPSCSCFVK
ncbi:MAG: hypothetical protein OXF90_03635 [Chloroflexi bacterium]|nr:hypothetical protein [Chloroflexota bacterium]